MNEHQQLLNLALEFARHESADARVKAELMFHTVCPDGDTNKMTEHDQNTFLVYYHNDVYWYKRVQELEYCNE